jgi:DNA invertase Pin-like site-specific DNA recombinase
MAMKTAVGYLRVSPRKRGKSGPELQAQEAALYRFAQMHGYRFVETFTEIERSGGADALDGRPQLLAALRIARRNRAPIVVTKLSRLSRDADFISDLMTHKIPFIVTEMGAAADPFMLHMYQHYELARRAGGVLAAKKAQAGSGLNSKAMAARQAALERAEALRPTFAKLQGKSASEAARLLNQRKVATPTGRAWSAVTVIRTRTRLGMR